MDQTFIDGLKTQLQKLNESELTALRADVGALMARPVAPSPKAYITETGSNESGWWRKYSDGFIEQGGVFATSGSVVVDTKITFQKNFNTTTYAITAIAEPDWISANGHLAILKDSKTVTTVTIRIKSYSDNFQNGRVFWTASGY